MTELCACGADATARLAAVSYCRRCYDAEIDWIKGRIAARQATPTIMTCKVCRATWRGFHGDSCWWCAERERKRRELARAIALEEPDPEHPAALAVAGLRLADAVSDGTLTPNEAASTMTRWLRRDIAA